MRNFWSEVVSLYPNCEVVPGTVDDAVSAGKPLNGKVGLVEGHELKQSVSLRWSALMGRIRELT